MSSPDPISEKYWLRTSYRICRAQMGFRFLIGNVATVVFPLFQMLSPGGALGRLELHFTGAWLLFP